MKYINVKKVISIISAGFLLLSISGCQKKQVSHNSNNSNIENFQYVENDSTPELTDNSLKDKIDNELKITTLKNKENEVIEYFENLELEVTSYINQENFENFKEKAKNIAITGIDFIFYGTEIKGVTFEELTTETKEKIINIVASIDIKVEEKIPGYKEKLKDKFGQGYSYVTEKLQKGLDYVDNELNDKYGQKYQDTKDKTSEITQNIKEGATSVFEKASEEVSDGWSKIKQWYENKTDK